MKQLVLASGNAGKLKELSALLAPLGIEVLPQSAFNVSEAEEPHPSFVENAIAKARHAARATGLPALADDSGLCVDALGGAPGVLSARFAGEPKSDQRNNDLLLERLAGQAGFGYDPLFLVPDLEQTAAEIPAELKNVLSHRGSAFRQLLDKLRAEAA